VTLVELLPSLSGIARARLEDHRWPADTVVDVAGEVVVGGVGLAGLAGTFGTPVHVLSEHEVRRSCRAYVDLLPGARVVCSPVELPWPEVLGWCAEEGLLVAEPGLRGRGLRYPMSGDVPSTEACTRDVVRAIARLRRDHGVELDELAVEITADAPAAFDLTGLATRLRVAINGESLSHGITPPSLTVEPGRSLVVRAVVGVCRVRSVERGVVSVDGPPGSIMRVIGRVPTASTGVRRVVGPSGESAEASVPEDVSVEDLLAVPYSGGRPHAPLFAVADGVRRLVDRDP
jgi:diaminopimelate decarboxylase